MRSRTSLHIERAQQEEALHDNESESSYSGLLDEKEDERTSVRSYEYRNAVRIPEWVRDFRSYVRVPTWLQQRLESARLQDRIKNIASLSSKSSRRIISLFVICAITILGLLALRQASKSTAPPSPPPRSTWLQPVSSLTSAPLDDFSSGPWKKPAGFQIVGTVFYGRRVHVDILDCYLKQNLVTNGGYLDGVVFLQNTDDPDDIAYLHELLDREPRYKLMDLGPFEMDHFQHMYEAGFDDDTMYFKIDDDLVYIHPEAIPRMVHTLLEHPEAHNVQANIVNSPSTSWYHYHSGAVRPFLPEIVPPTPWIVNWTTWRPSELPFFPTAFANDEFALGHGPPFTGHRWLPLEEKAAMLDKTPIRKSQLDVWGNDWKEWGIGAQHHYSLLSNIEQRTMGRYVFGAEDGVFNTQFLRYKINLMALWGSTLNMMKPSEDDEGDLTEKIPRKLGMPVLVQTRAIAAHFSFGPQRQLYRTDLMDRYRAYANENVCAGGNKKKQFPDWLQTLEKWGVEV